MKAQLNYSDANMKTFSMLLLGDYAEAWSWASTQGFKGSLEVIPIYAPLVFV